MFDYPYLEALRAVEKEGTYERAAHKLGITRSAISQKIRLLDERWGTVTTARKPVRTTAHGARLCRHVDQVQLLETQLFLQAGHLFNAYEIEPHAIKLLFDTDLLQTGFLDELSLFMDSQNDFAFEITRTSNDVIQAKTNPNTVATAISTHRSHAPHYEAHHLGSKKFLAVAHPEFAEQNFSSGLTASAFQKAPCVTYGGSRDYSELFLSQVFGKTIQLNARQLHSNSGILKACLKKKGWGILTPANSEQHLKEGELVDLFPGDHLSVDLYFYVSNFISKVLPEVVQTVTQAAHVNLNFER